MFVSSVNTTPAEMIDLVSLKKTASSRETDPNRWQLLVGLEKHPGY
jgi:hypothetical protein